jgi:chromosome segregation ATPase
MVVEMKHDVASLEAVLQRTQDAKAGIAAQVETAQERITMYRQDLGKLDEQEAALDSQVSALEASIVEAESALRQARTVAIVSKDTALEASTAGAVTEAEAKLSGLREQFTKAQTHRDKEAKQIARQREHLQGEIAKDLEQVAALQRQAGELKDIELQTHNGLGQAVYQELMYAIEGGLETEENLEAALAEYRRERLALEDSLRVKLRDWPSLLKQAQASVDARQPVEQPASVQLAQAAIRYLRKLVEEGPHLAGTRGYPRAVLPRLFDFNASGVESSMKPGFADVAQRRINQLEEYARQIEQEAKELQWSIERYR